MVYSFSSYDLILTNKTTSLIITNTAKNIKYIYANSKILSISLQMQICSIMKCIKHQKISASLQIIISYPEMQIFVLHSDECKGSPKNNFA